VTGLHFYKKVNITVFIMLSLATEPNTRTLVAPYFAAILRISSRFDLKILTMIIECNPGK